MGCDIHCFAEIKVNDQWHYYGELDIVRNYDLFGAMAGVRHSGTEIFSVRGLPKDLSFVTSLHWKDWEGEGHTPSWINSAEIAELIKRFPKSLGFPNFRQYLFGGSYEGFVMHPKEFPESLQDVRWVFWFDN
ncbi:hypothetical protein ACQ4M3_19335 [Leptolyngbya sp. AN03gr2]|uniref:hypothetical protein n=1 Tax=Leptolyngbya sp. AN03gr2 TaxID=3423364 RepID=UPI003D31E750